MSKPSPAESDRASQTGLELRLMLLSTAGMLAFGALCWLAFAHATPSFKGWLGRRHLPALQQFAQENDWERAIGEMQEARRWAPDDPAVLRASIDLIFKAGGDPRSAAALIDRLRQTGEATPADLALLGRTHVRLGEVSKARALLDMLHEQAHEQPETLRLQADILAAGGKADEAADALRKILDNAPDDREILIELAAADLASNDPARRQTMQRKLWQFVRAGGATLPAIELLAEIKTLTTPEVKELLHLEETAQGTDAAKTNARLKVLSAQMRLSPHLRTDLLHEEIKRWENVPPGETTPLLAWLADEHEHALILRLVPAAMAARHTRLLPHYVNALRGEGRWQELGELLKSGRIDTAFSAQKIRLWQAETQSRLENDPARAVQRLNRVFEDAGRGDHLEETLETGRLAEQLGHWELAGRCYRALAIKHPHTRPAMLTRLYTLAESQRDGPAMLSACASLLKLRPEDAALHLQSLYLQMLMGTEIEIAHQQLQAPTFSTLGASMDQVHLLQALSAHRQGRQEETQAALPKISRPEQLPAGQRVVYAALLRLCGGDPGRAFRLVERVSPLLLLPEEKNFLQSAL